MAEPLFNRKLNGQATFIDVRTTREGKPYLQIMSGKKVDDEWQNDRVAIWQENIEDFFKALKEAKPFLVGNTGDSDVPF